MNPFATNHKIAGTPETGDSFFTILENEAAFGPGGLVGSDGTNYQLGAKDSPAFLIVEPPGGNGKLLIGGNTEAAGFIVLGMPRGTEVADLPKMVKKALEEAATLSQQHAAKR